MIEKLKNVSKKDIEKYAKWINFFSFFLIFGLNIFVFIIEKYDIFPLFNVFPAIMFILPITTLIGFIMLVWVRVNKPDDKASKVMTTVTKGIGSFIIKMFAIMAVFCVFFSAVVFPYVKDTLAELGEGCSSD